MHPKYKLDYFKRAGWEEEWIATAKEIVEMEWESSYKRYIEDGDEDGEAEEKDMEIDDSQVRHNSESFSVSQLML